MAHSNGFWSFGFLLAHGLLVFGRSLGSVVRVLSCLLGWFPPTPVGWCFIWRVVESRSSVMGFILGMGLVLGRCREFFLVVEVRYSSVFRIGVVRVGELLR